jgi:hypothetical protein
MNTRSLTWPRVAATLVVAIGLQVAWGVFLAWGSAMVYAMWQSRNQYYETLGIALDGTPVISSRSYSNSLDWSYRSLDGKPLPNQKDDEFLTPANLVEPIKPPRLYETPKSWPERVAGISDQQRTPTAWYVVRDDRPEGRCYLVGFDEKSKLLVGYIGRNGFRRTIPPEDEWFDLGRHTLMWGSGAIASTYPMQSGGLAINYGPSTAVDQRLPHWLLFLIDGNKLLEIDLIERSVRTIFESNGLVSVATLREPLPAVRLDANEDADDEEKTTGPVLDANNDNDTTSVIRQVTKLALRTTDRIVILDPPTGAQSQFSLPESVREKTLQIYSAGGEQLIVQWTYNYYEPHLMWLKSDGTVAREEKVTLASYPDSGTEALIVAVAAAPVPIGWMSVFFAVAPIETLRTRQASTFTEAVAHNLEPTWPALIAVIAVGVALAAWTYRLQRKYHRPATGIWCMFVFLWGAFGFLAYWFEHRRPKLEPCRECGQIVPRDRDACAACKTPFPAPTLVGTEIFA